MNLLREEYHVDCEIEFEDGGTVITCSAIYRLELHIAFQIQKFPFDSNILPQNVPTLSKSL